MADLGRISGQIQINTGRSNELIKKLTTDVASGMGSMEKVVTKSGEKISATMTASMAKMSSNVTGSIEKLENTTRTSFKAMETSVIRSNAAMAGAVNASMESLAAAVRENTAVASAGFNRLQSEMVQTASVMKASMAAMKTDLASGFKQLNTTLAGTNKALNTTAKTSKAAAKDMGDISKEVVNLDKRLYNASIALNSIGRGFTRLGGSLVSIAIPLAAIGVISVATFAKFERSLGQAVVLMGATASEVDILEKNIERLGKSTIYTMTQVANASGELAKGGLEFQQVIGALDGTLNLAAAAGIEFERAAVVMTDILVGYQLEATEATRITDQLAFAVTNASVNFEEMARAMQAGVSLHNLFGVSEEQTAALGAVMGSLGEKGAAGITPWRMLLTSLSRLPGAEAKKMDVWENQVEIEERRFSDVNDLIAKQEKQIAKNEAEREAWNRRKEMDLEDKRSLVERLEGEDPMGDFDMEIRKAEDRVARAKQALVDLEMGIDSELGGYHFELDLTQAENALEDAEKKLEEFINQTGRFENIQNLVDPDEYNEILRKLMKERAQADEQYHRMLERNQKSAAARSGRSTDTPEQAALKKRLADTELADAERDLRRMKEIGPDDLENARKRALMDIADLEKELAEGPEWQIRDQERLLELLERRKRVEGDLNKTLADRPQEAPLTLFDEEGQMFDDPLMNVIDQVIELKQSGVTEEDLYTWADEMNISRTALKAYGLIDEEFRERYLDMLHGVQEEYEGSAEELAEPGIEGLMGSFEKIKAAFEAAMVGGVYPFRDSLKDLMESKIIGWVEKLSEAFGGMSREQKEAAARMVVLTAIAGGLFLIFGRMTQGIGGIIGGLSGKFAALNKRAVEFKGTLGAVTAATGVGAVGAAGVGGAIAANVGDDAAKGVLSTAVSNADTLATIGGAAGITSATMLGTAGRNVVKRGIGTQQAPKPQNTFIRYMPDGGYLMLEDGQIKQYGGKAATQTSRPFTGGVSPAISSELNRRRDMDQRAALDRVMRGRPMQSDAMTDALGRAGYDRRMHLDYDPRMQRYRDTATGRITGAPTDPYYSGARQRWIDPVTGRIAKTPMAGPQMHPTMGMAGPYPSATTAFPSKHAAMRGASFAGMRPSVGSPLMQAPGMAQRATYLANMQGLAGRTVGGPSGLMRVPALSSMARATAGEVGGFGAIRALGMRGMDDANRLMGAGRMARMGRGAAQGAWGLARAMPTRGLSGLLTGLATGGLNYMPMLAEGAVRGGGRAIGAMRGGMQAAQGMSRGQLARRAGMGALKAPVSLAKGAFRAPGNIAKLGVRGLSMLGKPGLLAASVIPTGGLGLAALLAEQALTKGTRVYKDMMVSTGQADSMEDVTPWQDMGANILRGITGRDFAGERAYNKIAATEDQKFITDADREQIAGLDVSDWERDAITKKIIEAKKLQTQALREWQMDRENIVSTLDDPKFIEQLEKMGIDIWDTIPSTLYDEAKAGDPGATEALSEAVRNILIESGHNVDVELPQMRKHWKDRLKNLFSVLGDPEAFNDAKNRFIANVILMAHDIANSVAGIFVHLGTQIATAIEPVWEAIKTGNIKEIVSTARRTMQTITPVGWIGTAVKTLFSKEDRGEIGKYLDEGFKERGGAWGKVKSSRQLQKDLLGLDRDDEAAVSSFRDQYNERNWMKLPGNVQQPQSTGSLIDRAQADAEAELLGIAAPGQFPSEIRNAQHIFSRGANEV